MEASDALPVVLSILVVSSVLTAPVGLATAFHGIVARGGDELTFNPGIGGPNDVIVSNATPVVYQGESGSDFQLPSGETVPASRLVGGSGDAEGQLLQLPIPQDKTPGLYTLGEQSERGVVVQTPRITEFSLVNERGFDVKGANVEDDKTILVEAKWNFKKAEDLSLVVRNERGTDITGEVLTSAEELSAAQKARLSGPYATYPEKIGTVGERGTGTGIEYLQGLGQVSRAEIQNSSRLDTAYWALDLSEVGPGNVTVSVGGWDALDFGPASRSATIGVTGETETSLGLGSDEATRGERVGFSVRNSAVGAVHNVTIDADDFRGDEADERVFETVNDVVDRGSIDTDDDGTADLAYATVQIDDDTGVGEGQLDTSYLDDTSIDLDVFSAGANVSEITGDEADPTDERTLDLEEPTLGIGRPAGVYTVGEEIDVNGTAARGIDEVALYVRNQGDWELLDLNGDGSFDDADTVTVDSDGNWQAEDVTLSEANSLLSFSGRYELGVVEARDITEDGRVQETLSNPQFSGATSTETTLLVEEPELGSQRTFQLVNEQISVTDGTIDVRGSAPGLEQVLIVMVDDRGRVTTEQLSVNDEGVFEKDDIDLSTPQGRSLSEGQVQAFVFGVGRDAVVGDGVLPNQDRATIGALEDYVKVISSRGLTQEQMVERLLAQTTRDTASDDLLIRESFQYAESSTRITSVVPAAFANQSGVTQIEVGETMIVSGKTNRQPDRTSITVGVVAGPSVGQFPVASTDEWGANGTWSVRLDTAGVEPGTYTIEVDDGDTTDRLQIQIVPEGARGPPDSGNQTNGSVLIDP